MVLFSDWAPDRRPLKQVLALVSDQFCGKSRAQLETPNLKPKFATICDHVQPWFCVKQRSSKGALRIPSAHWPRAHQCRAVAVLPRAHGEQNCPSFCHSWPWSLLGGVTNKFAYQIKDVGDPAYPAHFFKKPWFLELLMFIGMTLSFPLHWAAQSFSKPKIADGTASESLLPEEAVLGWQKVAVESFCLAKWEYAGKRITYLHVNVIE